MARLDKLKVALLATDGFELTELTSPKAALEAEGAKVDVISLKSGTIQGFRHHDKADTVKVDKVIDDVRADDYDALVLPGGALNADTLRAEDSVRLFIKSFSDTHKPMAVICHAPWELISAGVIRGRSLTSYHTIRDDVINAGAAWTDEEVVVDDNLVTSRQPEDLPAFNREMIEVFGSVRGQIAA